MNTSDIFYGAVLIFFIWALIAAAFSAFVLKYETCDVRLCKSDRFTGSKHINSLYYCTNESHLQLSKPIMRTNSDFSLVFVKLMLFQSTEDSACNYIEVS